MQTLSPARPSAKTITRSLRYRKATRTLTITITTGNRVVATDYSLERIGSDFGDGFALTKHVPLPGDQCEMYHVHLSDEGHACDCMGSLRWGRCKHVDALAALRNAGKI